MSKTEKTRPLHLRALERPSWTDEFHWHVNGRVCDLPPAPTASNIVVWPGARDGCCWQPSREFFNQGISHCNCKTCARHRDEFEPYKDGKAERLNGRAAARKSWDGEFE